MMNPRSPLPTNIARVPGGGTAADDVILAELAAFRRGMESRVQWLEDEVVRLKSGLDEARGTITTLETRLATHRE